MKIKTLYTSCGCNQTPTAVDWGLNNLICYASSHSVNVFDPQLGNGGLIIYNLLRHLKRVNSVRWIRGICNEYELVSGSTDGTAIVWTLPGTGESIKSVVLKGHTDSVTIVNGLYKFDDCSNCIVATVSMDSTVRLWHRSKPCDEFAISQCIAFGLHVVTGLAMFAKEANRDVILLACAPDDSTIQLFSSENDSNFKMACVLKGHEDWVRSLDFIQDGDGHLLLASSSQDCSIRITRVMVRSHNETSILLETALDSVLLGHEGIVYSVQWCRLSNNTLQLLSASLDKSIIVWELDKVSMMWTETARVGVMAYNTLGFYGAVFNYNATQILAHGYHGAFYTWSRNVIDHFASEVDASWKHCPLSLGGHFGAVTDLQWQPVHGDYLITASSDQTVRIHCEWKANCNKEDQNILNDKSSSSIWYQIGRPQIHGYDMNALAFVTPFSYASVSEEKVIRTFDAPIAFRKTLQNIAETLSLDNSTENIETYNNIETISQPSLGLSNKQFNHECNAVQNDNLDHKGYNEDRISNRISSIFTEPPSEEILLQHTLWPETQKLYGHGYEVFSLAASPDGTLLASSCKATNSEHAAILLWDVRDSCRQIGRLTFHTLTVVQMAFSPDSRYLLAVSRDRQWSVFCVVNNTNRRDDSSFQIAYTSASMAATKKYHTRIIWCCAWTPDGRYFATGSRDGRLCIWRHRQEMDTNDCSDLNVLFQEFKGDAVTAVAFGPAQYEWSDGQLSYVLAVGFESGLIRLFRWTGNDGSLADLCCEMRQCDAHHFAVRRLAFRPRVAGLGPKLQLASGANDGTVRIYEVLCPIMEH